MPKVIISVSNDLSTDQRVSKICNAFIDLDYDILLIGRELPTSLQLQKPYPIKRYKLWFKRGVLFYAELNLRLFITLLFSNTKLLYANDLDTLLPNFIVAKIKSIPIIYDSHELFTEVPELKGSFKKNIWKSIEAFIFPKLQFVITVNQSISNYYHNLYRVKPHVLRNLAQKQKKPIDTQIELNKKSGLHKLILQGSGINKDRGAEEAIEMMQFLNDCELQIIGSGDVIPTLKKMVLDLKLQNKVTFYPKMPYQDMMSYTRKAHLGLSLDKNTNLNYRYSLPNKIFDYLQAGIPMAVSNLPEVAQIVNQYQLGVVLKDHHPKEMANQIRTFLNHEQSYLKCKKSILDAQDKLCWETEVKTLKKVIQDASASQK